MGCIKSLREPKDACELAKAIEVMLLDGLNLSCGGGWDSNGGDFFVQLDRQEVAILVMRSDQRPEAVDQIWEGRVSEWLDADEQEIIRAHRRVMFLRREEKRLAVSAPVAKPKRKRAAKAG